MSLSVAEAMAKALVVMPMGDSIARTRCQNQSHRNEKHELYDCKAVSCHRVIHLGKDKHLSYTNQTNQCGTSNEVRCSAPMIKRQPALTSQHQYDENVFQCERSRNKQISVFGWRPTNEHRTYVYNGWLFKSGK